MKFVYLAGPIFGCSDDEANSWRWHLTRLLEPYELVALDPMRRDYRGQEDANVRAIIDGDLADIRQASAMVVRCDRPSWGTAMELRFAFAELGLPVVGLCERGTKISPWLRGHASEIVHTVGEAAAAVGRLVPSVLSADPAGVFRR